MPETRSRSKNRAPEFVPCAEKCSSYLEISVIKFNIQESVSNVKDWYWVCEDCYLKLTTKKQSSCFQKIPCGGFFDPSEDSPTSQKSSSGVFGAFSALYNFLQQCICNETLCEVFDTFFSRKLIFFHLAYITLIVSICVYFSVYDSSAVHEPKTISIEVKIEKSFRELENTFRQQDDDLWFNLVSGFSDIASNNDSISPATFLILHSNDTKTSFCIINKVCNLAHELLNVASRPLVLDGVNLGKQYSDQGEFIVEIKDSIRSRKISVIRNLHKIPGDVARAFHGLVDAYNPLVEKVVYLMSIPINESLHFSSPYEFAEDFLHETWRDVEEDTLGPLITRLTTNVVEIKDESTFPDYC